MQEKSTYNHEMRRDVNDNNQQTDNVIYSCTSIVKCIHKKLRNVMGEMRLENLLEESESNIHASIYRRSTK